MENTNLESKAGLVERDTIVVTREEISQDFIHPEKVRLQLDKKVRLSPLDIGALAYTIRQPQINSSLAHLPCKVNKDSFKANRRKLLVALHDFVGITGNLDTTVKFHLDHFIRIITWFDEHGHIDVFESEYSARKAYVAYVNELNHQVKSCKNNGFDSNTGNKRQRELIKLFDLYWGDDSCKEIIREIPIIKFKRKDGDAPEERNVRFATKTFLHLARGFKCFVMENKPFPYLLKMPEYDCYVFPSNGNACVTPYAKIELISYHYQEGRISTAKEYKLKCSRPLTENEARKEVENAQINLSKINENPRDINRLNYASLAMQSYMQLFILMTGINPSELVQLEYDESFVLEKDLLKNDFRAIKMRAGGREVAYHLGSRKGLKLFKEYIQLRKWVLNGVNCANLFFTMDRKGEATSNFNPFRSADLHRVYRRVKGKFVPPSFAPITANKVRKYKTLVWNEIDVSQEIIADSLNHTLKTNHKYYAVSSPEKQQAEFGLFFESARAAAKQITTRGDAQRIPLKVIHSNEKASDTTSIASGHCDDFHHPDAMEDEPPIAPNCQSQMGCLYCEHYICHSDDQDIKKLYSLLYVIEAVRNMATDFNHSDKLLFELNIRIKLVLTQMSEKSDDIKLLVESVKEEVMEYGILTPFWEFRLRRYEQMGVVI